MSASSYALSQATFESLLPSIVSIIGSTQPHDPATAPAQRQEIAKAASRTIALRSQLANARDLVDALPGGEMLLEHQHEVIKMLTGMRNARRAQLARLSNLSLGNPE